MNIWNLATPYIEGCFNIEAFNIEGCFNIEYTTFDIEVFASISKLTKKAFNIEETSISKAEPSISGSDIEVIRYRS